jgi:glycerophosphoryl diester phosphodiesterase
VTHPWFEDADRPRILAHRGLLTPEGGAAGVAENSFAAVAAATAAGATYIESDCHLTLDGTVVLFHDDTLTRVTGDPRRIAEVEVRELEDLMATRGGLILLTQALETFPTVRFNLDAKADGVEEQMARDIAPHADRVLVASFSDQRRIRVLRAVAASGHGILPATSAGTLTIARVVAAVGVRSDRLLARALSGLDALQVPERRGAVRIVTNRFVDAAHRHGVEVHVWTVNEPADMRRLLALGVDGLVTDRADVGLAVAAEHV